MLMKERLSSDLEYSIAYTYSKCMTNSLGYYGQVASLSKDLGAWNSDLLLMLQTTEHLDGASPLMVAASVALLS